MSSSKDKNTAFYPNHIYKYHIEANNELGKPIFSAYFLENQG